MFKLTLFHSSVLNMSSSTKIKGFGDIGPFGRHFFWRVQNLILTCKAEPVYIFLSKFVYLEFVFFRGFLKLLKYLQSRGLCGSPRQLDIRQQLYSVIFRWENVAYVGGRLFWTLHEISPSLLVDRCPTSLKDDCFQLLFPLLFSDFCQEPGTLPSSMHLSISIRIALKCFHQLSAFYVWFDPRQVFSYSSCVLLLLPIHLFKLLEFLLTRRWDMYWLLLNLVYVQ